MITSTPVQFQHLTQPHWLSANAANKSYKRTCGSKIIDIDQCGEEWRTSPGGLDLPKPPGESSEPHPGGHRWCLIVRTLNKQLINHKYVKICHLYFMHFGLCQLDLYLPTGMMSFYSETSTEFESPLNHFQHLKCFHRCVCRWRFDRVRTFAIKTIIINF